MRLFTGHGSPHFNQKFNHLRTPFSSVQKKTVCGHLESPHAFILSLQVSNCHFRNHFNVYLTNSGPTKSVQAAADKKVWNTSCPFELFSDLFICTSTGMPLLPVMRTVPDGDNDIHILAVSDYVSTGYGGVTGDRGLPTRVPGKEGRTRTNAT